MIRSLLATLVGTVVAATVVAGCAGSATSSAPGSSPASVAPATDSASPAASSAPPPASQAAASPTATAADAGVFYLCPTTTDDAACPLAPGTFQASIHDAFDLSIPDDGWQEERSPASEEPSVILSRIEAPEQRVTIDTGSTRAILDAAGLLALVAGAAPIQAGEPVAASIGGADGYAVDLVPTGTTELVVPGGGTVVVEPGHQYRLFALQFPMVEESGIKVILIDAPADQFTDFSSTASDVLESLTFH